MGAKSASPYVNASLGLRWMLRNNFVLTAEHRRAQGFMRNSKAWGGNRSSNNYLILGLQWSFGAVERPARRGGAPNRRVEIEPITVPKK